MYSTAMMPRPVPQSALTTHSNTLYSYMLGIKTSDAQLNLAGTYVNSDLTSAATFFLEFPSDAKDLVSDRSLFARLLSTPHSAASAKLFESAYVRAKEPTAKWDDEVEFRHLPATRKNMELYKGLSAEFTDLATKVLDVKVHARDVFLREFLKATYSVSAIRDANAHYRSSSRRGPMGFPQL